MAKKAIRRRKGAARRKRERQRIALERIEILYNLALQRYSSDYKLAQRYIWLARRIAMKARVRQPRYLKRVVCKHCKSFIIPGYNCRVRIRQRREPHVAIYCMVCKRFTRIPLKRRLKA